MRQVEPDPVPGVVEPGVLIGERFECVRSLGEGGMARVYRVLDCTEDRVYALKVPKSRGSCSSRFQREIAALERLSHPNVITIYRSGEHLGRPFLVMELMKESLYQLVKREGPLAPWRACALMMDVLGGLEAVHEEGLLHRDITPRNILLDAEGRPKLSDFGLVRDRQVDSSLTQLGGGMGTLHYMAPEQKNGNSEVDQRADLYAVGATLFYAVTGAAPHTHIGALSVPLEGLPSPLAELIQRATRAEPDKRFESAAALREAIGALQRALAGVSALPAAAPAAAPRDESCTVHGSSDRATLPSLSATLSSSGVESDAPRRTRRWLLLLILPASLFVARLAVSPLETTQLEPPREPPAAPREPAQEPLAMERDPGPAVDRELGPSEEAFPSLEESSPAPALAEIEEDPPAESPPPAETSASSPAPPPPARARTHPVTINSIPPSQVFVDEVLVNSTPLRDWPLPEGTRQITLRRPDGTEKSRTVVVGPDAPVRVCWHFKKQTDCSGW